MSNKCAIRGPVLATILLPGILLASGVHAKPLLETSTESPLQNEQAPPPALAQYLWQHLEHDDQQIFRENCVQSGRKIRSAFRSALEYQPLPSVSSQERLFFIRSTANTGCIAFYGAHIFEFWLVAQNTQTQAFETLINDRADQVSIPGQTTHQRYDVTVSNCTAASCFNTLLQYSGTAYTAKQCQQLTSDDKGQDIAKTVACQSH